MKKKKISTKPLKDLFAKESLRIPQCWVAEKAEDANKKALAQEKKDEIEKTNEKRDTSLFWGGGAKVVQGPEGDGESAINESDTESESDLENDQGGVENAKLSYKYEPLSKQEVFSYMQQVHDRVGPNMLGTESAVRDIERAQKMIDILYEQLSVETLKAMSQQNRINASLNQESLVYGEMGIPHFLKVSIHR